jgi:hypothetical protein
VPLDCAIGANGDPLRGNGRPLAKLPELAKVRVLLPSKREHLKPTVAEQRSVHLWNDEGRTVRRGLRRRQCKLVQHTEATPARS